MTTIRETDGHLPILETERLMLRKLALEDMEDMFEYASEPIVSRYVPWEVHKSPEDTKAFLAFMMESYEQKKKLTWAIELKSDKKMIGTIDFINWMPKRHKAELAYILSHNYWGKGFMAEAAGALLAYGFGEMELNKVEAPIGLENLQSQRVVEKLGMKREGIARQHIIIKGRFVDLAMYSLLKSEYLDEK
ncbi:GNAT family N-acetyltransferase [Planomicrobium sp. CPCC 101079]|uniref:GNAT family N-acetyltransferase n=1 Tax=Planomicrobium sp. CPCC 101079 TaxID=2599618 RepID=UPI0011B3E70F|nr:GNAT family protein [Planomicrobium sp. CPCC 101079]TWT13209.1 GNAT family N-acetyltransferase [Planomicrobium sp. CPCC 101079]